MYAYLFVYNITNNLYYIIYYIYYHLKYLSNLLKKFFHPFKNENLIKKNLKKVNHFNNILIYNYKFI